jgi:hypothetical protein
MPARQNLFQRSKAFVLIGVGLLFGMIAAFPPNLHGEYAERMGMIESADHGATWQFKGHADFHAPEINPVDPSALFDNGLLVFYFFDLMSLSTDTAVVYRSVATDGTGLDFSPPARAFQMPGFLTDPAVVKMQNGKYRMYVQGQNAILSATSDDGFTFTLDPGERTRAGGVPGVIVLPDGRVRLYVSNSEGITSLISDDGFSFTPEPGVRIPGAGAPSPVRCADGVYRMACAVRPAGQGESPELDEVHLAESADGFLWTPGLASLVTGSVPTLVELPDGRLRIYYVDFQPDEPAGLFKFIKTVQVTPDTVFKTGSFARINYLPATNRFIVTFGTKGSPGRGNAKGAGYAYKEYTVAMKETGKAATFTWNSDASEANDSGSCMVEDNYYFVHVPTDMGMPYGWRITKFDAVNWIKLDERTVQLVDPNEANLDPCVAFLNGQLDVSDQYNPAGKWQEGGDSHHRFFSLNLDSLGYRILDDSPHISGASMIFVDGAYSLVSADSYTGDLVVLKYDADWNFLGVKSLIQQAFWSQGVAFDGERFFVSYLNTSLRDPDKFFPVHLNVHLAAFDRDWNLIEDVAVTHFTPTSYRQPGRPWVLLHGDNLYVSYDVDTIDSTSKEEQLSWQAFVSVYEISQGPSSVEEKSRGTTMPSGFTLYPNYPNPFNPGTTIRFDLPKAALVRLSIYNLMGQENAVLVNEMRMGGAHEVLWDGCDSRHARVPSGVYLYRLEAAPHRATGKLLMLK